MFVCAYVFLCLSVHVHVHACVMCACVFINLLGRINTRIHSNVGFDRNRRNQEAIY